MDSTTNEWDVLFGALAEIDSRIEALIAADLDLMGPALAQAGEERCAVVTRLAQRCLEAGDEVALHRLRSAIAAGRRNIATLSNVHGRLQAELTRLGQMRVIGGEPDSLGLRITG